MAITIYIIVKTTFVVSGNNNTANIDIEATIAGKTFFKSDNADIFIHTDIMIRLTIMPCNLARDFAVHKKSKL